MTLKSYRSVIIIFVLGSGCISTPPMPQDFTPEQRFADALEEEFWRTYDPALMYVPSERMHEALRQTREMQRTMLQRRSAAGLNPKFNERGPNDIGGRTRAIHLDLRDPERKKTWVGSVSGGLYVTEDITAPDPSWKNVDDYLENLSVSSIVQDFDDPMIMYMGTGEAYGGGIGRGLGIFKSIDGGETWELLQSTLTQVFQSTRGMAIQPETGFVYAALAGGGVRRSEDGGETWIKVLGVGLTASDDSMYDVFSVKGKMFASNTRNIYMSETGDLGTWIHITKSGSGFPTTWSRTEFSVCEQDENVLMAVGAIGGGGSAIIVSTDGGATWNDRGMPGGGNNWTGQAGYDLDIAIDPFDCSKAIVAGIPLWRTTNQAASWNELPHSSYNFSGGHVDQHKVYFDTEQQGVVYFGNDGGLWRSSDGAGQTIVDKNFGYITTQYYGCAIHPDTFSNYMLGGTQDNGSHQLNTPGVSSGRNVWGGDGFLAHIDQNDSRYQMVSSQFGNWGLSSNGGNSFSGGIGVNGGFLNPSDYDSDSGILYTQTGDGDFYRWHVKTGQSEVVNWTGPPGGAISTVAVDPNIPNRVYFGTRTGRVILIDNANEGDMVEAVELEQRAGTVSSIAVANGNSDNMIVTYSNYGINNSVITSDDGGQSWVTAEGNLPDMPIRWGIFSPKDPSEALIATETGVWSTTQLNGTATIWDPPLPGEGSPIVSTRQLDWRKSDLIVIAATYGRGLWTSSVFAEPRAKFIAPQVHYLNSPLQFIGEVSLNATSYEWDFGDGTSSTEVNPVKVYTEIGEYPVLLTINGDLTTNSTVKILPEVPLPYVIGESTYSGSFENFEEHYGTEITNGSEFSKSNSVIIGKNGTKSGNFAMVLDPTNAFYEKNTHAAFYLPEFDFTDESIYTFSFWANHWIQGSDGFIVEYSVNGGQTWNILGKQESGWYNFNSNSLENSAWPNNTPYFTKEVGAYSRYSTNVSFLSGQADVAFRFQFRSDGSGFHPGVAIDDVEVSKFEGDLQTNVTVFTGGFTDGNKEITLEWSTIPEYYCQTFEIERSVNGRDFEKIAQVQCKGNVSDRINKYKFKDSQGGNLFFYRLKVINEDPDGDYSFDFYSPTITVRRSTFDGVEVYIPDSGPRIFPNPFSDQINITFTDKVDQTVVFELYDISGRLVFRQEEFVNDVFTALDLFQVVAGMYYLSIKIGENEVNVFPVMGGF
jgi:PKD repeat protein